MDEIKTEYINIQSDFGFKHVFGDKANKKALIRFLNIVFKDKLVVTDVVYHDKEVLPADKEGKRIVYDVYCTLPYKKSESPYFPSVQTAKGDAERDHHFILEMQNIYTVPFEERLTYYATKMIAEQGKSGWKYELEPVFAIAVTDFNFSHMVPKLMRDIMLADRDSAEPFTDKLHIILCSLMEVPERWEDCSTELEQILFLIKNMEDMNSTSLAYREGNFTEVFDAAKSSRLSKDQIIPYSQSLERLRELQSGIIYAADNAREEGLRQGRNEGRAEGRAMGFLEGIHKVARNLRKKGMDSGQIAELTSLSIDEIESLD